MGVRWGAVTVVVALVAGTTTASAVSASGTSGYRPVVACADLVREVVLPGARAHVTEAVEVPAGAEPAHCAVRGYVEPAVRFALELPTTTYAGRYLQYGCGGFCGELVPPVIPDCGARVGGTAVATTDDGHVGAGGPLASVDGTWAADDQAARDDFAFRAPHVVSLAAKRVIERFYGAPPRFSYFSGCSNGGREALLLAQRYPHDFDGVVAGAPANYLSAVVVLQAWLARVNTGADGLPVLTTDRLPVLHDAVLARCDTLDGLADGVLEDPRRCDFDPGALTCQDGPACLTPQQVDVVRKLYDGPRDERGRRLYPSGLTRGSEPAWYGWTLPSPEFGDVPLAARLADNYLRYMGYPIGAPHSSLDDFRFTAAEFRRLDAVGARHNAMALDLSAFRRAGGRLVLWHGWNDQAIPPAGLLDYHDRLKRRHGGDLDRWTRLFLVPGLHHCSGGDRISGFDPLPGLLRWVEQGAAPDRVIATGRDEGGAVRTRPVFPYPLTARYDGTGSVDDAANFVPARPSGPVRDAVDWYGAYLHHLPGPVAPGR
ncbi:tannase/feruloyl esterase family alpha/beta hydrolase [Saccharothrix sp. Mg75]|uniref:tannase/feruloyl esterase family alpha/beta hydrolase n=1 Tax=Saccharothrix sp. Mg75 TaxID=3445357 RepID=UPI003EEABCA9